MSPRHRDLTLPLRTQTLGASGVLPTPPCGPRPQGGLSRGGTGGEASDCRPSLRSLPWAAQEPLVLGAALRNGVSAELTSQR